MGSKHQIIRSLLTDAIIELCRREAFYVEELRIEGTLCLVSDRTTVLVTQITEQIGEKWTEDGDRSLPLLSYDRESTARYPQGKVEGDGQGQRRSLEEAGAEGYPPDDRTPAEKDEDRRRDDEEMMKLMPSKKTDGKYKCPFCPKAYGFKHNLKDHINKHTGRRPHVCKYCGLSFTFLASLCGHIKRRHFHCMPREHQCQICGNRFPNKQSLRQHFTWRHSPQRAAATAGRHRKNAKPRHVDVGDGMNDVDGGRPTLRNPLVIRPQADGLGAAARPDDTENMDLSQALGVSQPNQPASPPLEVDQLVGMHVPLLQSSTVGLTAVFPPPRPAAGGGRPAVGRPPPPPAAGRQLAENGAPELLRSATGKFHCPYCEKAYRFKHTLKDHINTHLGQRPHVCKFCSDAFTHFASLCAHIKRRHKEHIPRDFACAICNENFMNLQSLKQHFTWRHKDAKLPLAMLAGAHGPGRKLNSAPEIPPWNSPAATTSANAPVSAQPPGLPSATNGSTRRSPKYPAGHASPAPAPSNNKAFSPPILPSVDAFIKGGGQPFVGFGYTMNPDDGAMASAHRDGSALYSPMGMLPPPGSIQPPGGGPGESYR